MLDEEQRQKLLKLKKQLQPDVRPSVPLKADRHVQRIKRQETGKPLAAAAKRQAATSDSPREQPNKKDTLEERPVSLAILAKSLGVPLADLNQEIASRRKPGTANRPLRVIYPSYAESLRSFFAERRKWREDHPVRYRPDPSGRLTFETYERIPPLERAQLTADGYLPQRAELIKSPDRRWPQVQRHAEGRPPQTNAIVLEPKAAHPPFKPFPTTASIGSSLIPKMKAVLDPMSPLGYAKFFSLMRALLALDAKISREIGSTPGYLATNRQHADIIDAVCKYGFGMFAYEQAGKRLAKRAKSKPDPTRKNAIESLMRLRPMYQGLLTDVYNQRFVTWRVGEVWDFIEFRFEDMRDWLHGLETGQYVPLTTHITKVDGTSQPSSRDAALINYMIQASENLREGNAQRTQAVGGRSTKSSEAGSSNGRGGSRPNNRSVGYRAVNTWLVPINVVEGNVETELDRDFFNGKLPAPHQVRSFYRRPRGSGPNALKTEFVSAHTRGAKSLFHEPALLPSVTIVKK